MSSLCPGAMNFGAWGESDHDASVAVIHRALNAGINMIDTADVYARGESNRAKLAATEQLAQLAEQSGLSLIHLALAFTLTHPAVTAPIIGPRTMDQLESQLGAAEVTLGTDLLDRIDEIVPPGTTLHDFDRGYVPPALSDPFLRRRRTA